MDGYWKCELCGKEKRGQPAGYVAVYPIYSQPVCGRCVTDYEDEIIEHCKSQTQECETAPNGMQPGGQGAEDRQLHMPVNRTFEL